jgi:glycosyltransferase involved in cell wall biosynthesis
MKYLIKSSYIRLLRKNTDYWIIQSEETKKELQKKNWDDPKKIIIAPFWKSDLNYPKDLQKRHNLSFLYPCSPAVHKNLFRLIEAWENAFSKNHEIKLYLTLPASWFIENKIKFEKLNIIPLGLLNYPDLVSWYQRSEFLIFPSYCESFGLPLIEGLENGCKVIASDLPYTWSVIEPYMVFDPFVTDSIESVILKAAGNQPETQSGKNIIKIENKINQILSLI